MINPQDNCDFPGFIESRETPVNAAAAAEVAAEFADLEQYVKTTTFIKRGKIRELGIFTVGIGVILALLTFWISFAMSSAPGRQISMVSMAEPLTISVIYIVCGILTMQLKTRPIILTTIVLVTLGFALELLIRFDSIKAVISLLAIGLIVKTGGEALKEAGIQKLNG